MTSYIVLGGLLVLMGAAQMWMRWGPWAKEQRENEKAVAERRAEAVEDGSVLADRGSKLWNKWTAILGPLGIGLGIFLVVWGILQ
jgi:ferric-dicitrate binding protein FerR (iron transport regulator)